MRPSSLRPGSAAAPGARNGEAEPARAGEAIGARGRGPRRLVSGDAASAPRPASRCAAGSGNCACSSSSSGPAPRRLSSTSASPTRPSGLPGRRARATTSSRRATPGPSAITAVGHTGLDRFAAAFPRRRSVVQADGRELPFADGAFELGFSNAVIEHVAGGREGQRRFVTELCRVAGRVFVTTPNRWFPVDPHTLSRSPTGCPRAPRRRLFRARGFDDVLDPLGPGRAVGALSLPGEVFDGDDPRRGGTAVSSALVRRPVWILHVFVVGLALHNFVMAELYAAGVRGNRARCRVGLEGGAARRSGSCSSCATRLASLSTRGRSTCSRSSTEPSSSSTACAPALARRPRHPPRRPARRAPRPAPGGRLLLRPRPRPDRARRPLARGDRALRPPPRRRVRAHRHLRDSALVVAQLRRARLVPPPARLRLPGLSNLPENFVYNTGNEHPLRRLVSVFLSPLATSYMLVARCSSPPPGGCGSGAAPRLAADHGASLRGPALDALALVRTSHSRSACSSSPPSGRSGDSGSSPPRSVGGLGLVFVKAYPHIAPRRRYTASELKVQRQNRPHAGRGPGGRERLRGREHLEPHTEPAGRDLERRSTIPRASARATPARPPRARTCRSRRVSRATRSSASTPGSPGRLSSSPGAWRCSGDRCAARAWLGAAIAAMLRLGLQTDIIGVPWVVCLLWPLAGWRVSHPET